MLNKRSKEHRYRNTLNRLKEAQGRLNTLLRQTAIDPNYVEPEAFCARLLDDLQPPDDFFKRAQKAEPRFHLVWLLGALQAERCGDLRVANRRAGQAMSLNSRDLLAQRLHGRTASPAVAAPDLRGRFCSAPFQNIAFGDGGEVNFCCPAWLPVPIGNINEQSADEIWNSPRAQEIRRTIHDGSYRYCSRMHCPQLNKLPRKEEVEHDEHRRLIAHKTTQVPRGPQKLNLDHDRSCNLSCPSCRVSLITAKKQEVERLNRIADDVILPLAKNAHRIRITASGDPFGSAHFRHVLKRINQHDFPRLRIDLQTNGLLLDRQAWDDLEIEGLVDNLYISIDAADPITYGILRRGGELSRLLANLEFVSELRARGSVKNVRLDVVLQAMNYRELPAIVALAHKHRLDSVKCKMIRNWKTFTPTEFERHNIGSPNHPEYERLLDVLAAPELADGFVSYWGMEMARKAAMKKARQAARARFSSKYFPGEAVTA